MKEAVWITGSRGFIGAYVKNKLIEAGYVLKCITNSACKDNDVIQIDFSDRDDIKRAISEEGVPDVLIHLGWGNTDNPHHENHTGLNVDQGVNVFDEMYASGVNKIIFIGSSSEYGSYEGQLNEDMYSDDDNLNNYIIGKRTLGEYGLKVANKNKKVFIYVRLFYVYGAGQRENSLINQLYRCSLGSDKMQLSPCEHYRDYIYVQDVATGIEKLLHVNQSGVVNLGNGEAIQLKEFVTMLWVELGAESSRLVFGANEQPNTEQSQPNAYSNLKKLKEITNWVPEIPIEQGVKLTVDQLRSER